MAGMTLKELKDSVDHVVGRAAGREDEIPVLVTLAEPSVGPRASAQVEFATMGFDWEANQFRLQADVDLVRKGRAQDDILPPHEYKADGMRVRRCSACNYKLRQNDRYCPHCGQRLV